MRQWHLGIRRLLGLHPADHRVRDRQQHHLDQDLVGPAAEDVVEELRPGDDAREGDGAEDDGVGGLTHEGGADEP